MSFVQEATTPIKAANQSQSPMDLAKSYRGRRIELRQEFENTTDPEHKKFLEKALQKHTKLLIQDNRPIKSYLWKAEKNGHSVFLFGDVHRTVQKVKDFEGLNPAKDDLSPLFKTYIHPQVWQAFENSEQFYVEFFNFKHLTWKEEVFAKMNEKYPNAFQPNHSLGSLYLAQVIIQEACLAGGLVDYMLCIKSGTITPTEIASKLADFVKAMDDFTATEEAAENVFKLSEQGKMPEGWEPALEAIDAIQMGNLNSLALNHNENPFEIISDCEKRNTTYTSCILNALEKREKAFFAPGAAHYLGEKGILNLLEKQDVTITRLELD